jgi:hypothetical protein
MARSSGRWVGSSGSGLQFTWGEHLICHVTLKEAETQTVTAVGTVMVEPDSREVLSSEHAIVAKSLVMSKPYTRTGSVEQVESNLDYNMLYY